MGDMFPDTRPGFEELLTSLQTIECAINTIERIDFSAIAEMIGQMEERHLLIARLFPLYRSHGIQKAHGLCLKTLDIRRLEHTQKELEEKLKALLMVELKYT